ncbi:MAG: membrane-bound O-acyltransferase family protein [Candidatus Marinimicrobia bacterium]|nr:membrane-bound O-acyltransferase family protein [Candidatus Neomarinimicrobiota bacterium]
MLFNSIEFLIFLPVVFCLYWFVFNKHLKLQNLLILISSYIFYGWWDWRFLSLIFLSTVVDYFVGIQIFNNKNTKKKKSFLWLSIVFNLGLLGFFKYFNFFIESWVDLLSSVGYEYQNVWSLNIILPVGISFYTFQTMSYSLDIYYNKLKPTKDFISFASFVSFFPQLVAGPIERASNLLPQILKNRKFNYDDGLKGFSLIVWGMFKKVAIADNCAFFVDDIFTNYSSYSGLILLFGAIYFSIQIYCDFSGYSDIAIGTARLFGFKLMINFNFPYFSSNIGEFWKRWHISLSSWFRDYLYIPLGGSRVYFLKKIRNIFVIFIVSGFWHGANWTFIAWGFIHSIFYLLYLLYLHFFNYIAIHKNSFIKFLVKFIKITITYFSVLIAWIFFRSSNIESSINYIVKMVTDLFNINELIKYRNPFTEGFILEPFIVIVIFIFFEIRLYLDKKLGDMSLILLIFFTLYFGNFFNPSDFIYFQF